MELAAIVGLGTPLSRIFEAGTSKVVATTRAAPHWR